MRGTAAADVFLHYPKPWTLNPKFLHYLQPYVSYHQYSCIRDQDFACLEVSCSLNSLKGAYIGGVYWGLL